MEKALALNLPKPTLRILWVINLFGLGYVLWLFGQALIESPINPDAGYFIPMGERIAAGQVPFRDLLVSHTSILLYIFALISTLFGGHAPYEAYLGVVIAAQFAGSILIFFIAAQIVGGVAVPLFSAVLVLISSYAAEGTAIVLEPFVTLAVLAAVLIWSRSENDGAMKWFLSGALCGVAFVIKQYGLASLAAFTLAGMAHRSSRRTNFLILLLLISGFLTAAFLYFGYFILVKGISLETLLPVLLGAYYERNPEGFLLFFLQYFVMHPFILLVVLLLKEPHIRRDSVFQLLICMLIAFLPVGLVRQYPHYHLLLLPFSALLFLYVLSDMAKIARGRNALLAVTFILLGSLLFYHCSEASSQMRKMSRMQQLAVLEKLSPHLSPGERVLPIADPALYVLGNFRSADDLCFGYNFFEVLRDAELIRCLTQLKGASILIDRKSRYFHLVSRRLKTQGEDLNLLLARLGWRKSTVLPDNYEIWKHP